MSAHYTLSGSEAGSIAQRGRLLLRRGVITPFQYALLDAILWPARRPGSATLIASLPTLARLSGQARSTVAEGIAALERLGLIQRIKRRVMVAWHGGRTASRQIANAYRLIVPATGSGSRPAREQASVISIVEAPHAGQKAAQEALEAVRARRQGALAGASSG
jgi:DNA-binding transcriptional MocR family regulator